MITIIFAPPRTGKTCFMTHIAHETAFDRQHSKRMQREIMNKTANGFDNLKTVPTHCVAANYDMVFHKYRYSPRFSRRINPFRLGFANDFVQTHFNLPFECIFITEAQKYLNSRMSMYFPDWQSRWYEQHGHNDLDIWLDTQRPMLIDVNIRELSQFIEIMSLEFSYNGYGRIDGLRWHIRRIDNSALFDKYMASGKQDKTTGISIPILIIPSPSRPSKPPKAICVIFRKTTTNFRTVTTKSEVNRYAELQQK